MQKKLNLLMVFVNRMHTSNQHNLVQITTRLTIEGDGLFLRMQECEIHIDDFKDNIEKLAEENNNLKRGC